MNQKRPVIILDTDIGSDVDDAMALALLLGRADIDLIGVTTVYGDTALRARVAKRYTDAANREVPIHAGETEPRSGRAVWMSGQEGSLHVDLDQDPVSAIGAVDFLTEAVAAHPGEVSVIAIGPLTNIAAALDADAAFERAVRDLWVMGGCFGTDEIEHNFRSDAAAASRVFSSSIPTVICGLEITRRTRVDERALRRIAAAGPVGALLAKETEQWWQLERGRHNTPHDVVAALTLLQPELFEFSRPGLVRIAEGVDEGRAVFTADPSGTARIVAGLDVEVTTRELIDGIIAGSGG